MGISLIKRLWPICLIFVSFVLIVGSIGYGVFFVGIPGPDDPPHQLARQESEGNFVFITLTIGSLAFIIGTIAAITKLLIWAFRPNEPPQS